MRTFLALAALALCTMDCACGTPAQQAGVGNECAADGDCAEEQSCLDFGGGYCGLEGCAADDDCPGGSACVTHTDGENYCFLTCLDKPECNVNRSAELEANCSANVTFVEGQDEGVKACVPPSS